MYSAHTLRCHCLATVMMLHTARSTCCAGCCGGAQRVRGAWHNSAGSTDRRTRCGALPHLLDAAAVQSVPLLDVANAASAAAAAAAAAVSAASSAAGGAAAHSDAAAAAAAAAQSAAAAIAAQSAGGELPPPLPTTYVPGSYTPGAFDPGWQIWFAAFVSAVPFVIGAYEFGKRIVIQRRCKVCSGSGLVRKGRYHRKCPECGGFFPWLSWRQFLSANARPGNGGPLLQPRGQTSVFYTVPPANDGSSAEQQPLPEPTTGSRTEPGTQNSSEGS